MRLQLLSTRAPSLRLVAATALGALCVAGREARAQSRGAPPGARVAVLDLAFYGARANSLEPGDSALADSAAVAAAASTPDAAATASGRPCNVVVACARVVGRALGARWAVMGKVSKTSNLIWLFSGQLIDVATGELTLDDEYELKGVASEMVPAGARVFARRVAKRVAAEVAPAATPTVRSAAPASTTPR